VLKQIINEEDENPESGQSGAAEASAAKTSSGPKSSAFSGASGKNILSSDVEIKGKLRFSKDLVIDGRIEGEVNSEGDLTVGENAQIVGDINTRTVVVFGKIEGNITVTDRCELKQNAELHGDVTAGKLAIEEGAVFLGSSTVGSPTKLGGSGKSATPSSGSHGSHGSTPSSGPSSSSDSDSGSSGGEHQ